MDPSATSREQLQFLALALRSAAPALPPTSATDLTNPGALLALDERLLAAATAAPPPVDLATFVGKPGALVSWFEHAAAAKTAVLHALAKERRGRLLVVGGGPLPRAPFAATIFEAGAFAACKAVLAQGDDEIAALLVEPWLLDPADTVPLYSLLALALAHDVPVVFDEERTAGRAAPTAVHAALQFDASLVSHVLLGPSLAGGLPFAAVVGPGVEGAAAHPVAAAVLAAALRLRAPQQAHAMLDRLGSALRIAGDAAAKRENLAVRWLGPAAMPQLQFAGQEGAPPHLFAEHFAGELAALGWQTGGPLFFPPTLAANNGAALNAAFDTALVRIRAKLVEYNSWLSGGVACPWPSAPPLLQQRGLMLYRYPAMAKVRIAPTADALGMRIGFAAGALGDVTSSGFYAPTMLDGDLDVEARYRLQQWQAGQDSACFGLFLQNGPSTVRYYAQVMNTADQPQHRTVAASLMGQLAPRTAAPADEGWLRLSRQGGMLRAFHRPHEQAAWLELGNCPANADPLIVGAKIWSKGSNDALVVDVLELRVRGTPSAAQEALLGARPDPLGAG